MTFLNADAHTRIDLCQPLMGFARGNMPDIANLMLRLSSHWSWNPNTATGLAGSETIRLAFTFVGAICGNNLQIETFSCRCRHAR